MQSRIPNLTFDLRIGGLGDNWMRLVGFYVAAGLRPEVKIRLVVPPPLIDVARQVFSDRLEVLDKSDSPAIIYTVKGLISLLGPLFRGKRFASPYGKIVINDWDRRNIKELFKTTLYYFFDFLRLVSSPPSFTMKHYQGYAEVLSIPFFRNLGIKEFEINLERDFPHIKNRIRCMTDLNKIMIPKIVLGRVLVFPTGTGRQFIPLDWAVKNLSKATYAFFYKDNEKDRYRAAGLSTVSYRTPIHMLALAEASRVVVSTDSFPSHFLQYCANRLIVLITGTPSYRVVHSSFNGLIINAVASCHPCPHLARGDYPRCKAGHEVCINWDSSEYTARIMNAIERFPEITRFNI